MVRTERSTVVTVFSRSTHRKSSLLAYRVIDGSLSSDDGLDAVDILPSGDGLGTVCRQTSLPSGDGLGTVCRQTSLPSGDGLGTVCRQISLPSGDGLGTVCRQTLVGVPTQGSFARESLWLARTECQFPFFVKEAQRGRAILAR